MKNRIFNWNTDSGTNLFAQSWEPEFGSRNAVICLVHGLGEHSSRYIQLPNILVNNGYKLLSFDLRGHGQSGGRRGHVSSYQEFMKDINLLLYNARELFPDSDLFLYGHSMGGNLVLNYALRFKPFLKGIIVTNPWLKLAKPPSNTLIFMARMLDKFWPTFTTHNGLRSEDLASNNFKEKSEEKDTLLHPWISVHTYLQLAEASCWALENAYNFPYPLLILHGDVDKVTSPEGSRDFQFRAGNKSTLKIIHDLNHGIHSDPNSVEVYHTILDWLNAQYC